MNKIRVVIVLTLWINGVVLLGQVWPEGAPPFARVVNIVYLSGTLVYFLRLLRKYVQPDKIG